MKSRFFALFRLIRYISRFSISLSLFFVSVLSSDEMHKKSQVAVYEINFGQDIDRNFITHTELELWARNHNLLLIADAPYRNLDDGLAEVIVERGLFFRLYTQHLGRNYLYLDLVSYRSNGHELFSRVRWLDVYGNGELLDTIYQGGGKFLKSPIRITIDRENSRSGYIDVELRPSPGDGFWAIWDAFVSKSRI